MYQGFGKGKLEEQAVTASLDYLGDKVADMSLTELSEFVREVTRGMYTLVATKIDKGGRGLTGWRDPGVLTPAQGVLITHARLTVREVLPREHLDDGEFGTLAEYQLDGPYCGIYRKIDAAWIAARTCELVGAASNKSKWKDEYERELRELAPRVALTDDEDLIFFDNCVYDYGRDCTLGFSPELVSLVKSPWRLLDQRPPVPVHTKPNGKTLDVFDLLDSLASYPGGREFLLRVICAALRPSHTWRALVTLVNPNGHNGKSTFLDLLMAIVGVSNTMVTSVSELSDDQFALEGLATARLIACDDSDNGKYVRSTRNLKTIVGRGPIRVNPKGRPAYWVKPGALVVCAANELPRTKDKSDAWLDRNVYLPITGDFSDPAERDETIRSTWVKSRELCEFLIYYVLKELPHFGGELVDFEPAEAKEVKGEFVLENDPVADFWNEKGGSVSCDFLPNAYLWTEYQAWLHETRPNTKEGNRSTFISRIGKVVGDEWCPVDRKSVDAWIPIDESCVNHSFGRSVGIGWTQFFSSHTGEKVRGLARRSVYGWCEQHGTNPKKLGPVEYQNLRVRLGLEEATNN